jgi:hypothetical protein
VLQRRGILLAALAAPLIVRDSGILMPVRLPIVRRRRWARARATYVYTGCNLFTGQPTERTWVIEFEGREAWSDGVLRPIVVAMTPVPTDIPWGSPSLRIYGETLDT